MSFYDGYSKRRREEALLRQKNPVATLPPVEPRQAFVAVRSSSAGNVNLDEMNFTNRRMEEVEARLSRTEQSNRSLLDEVMRLQNQLKTHMRSNEDVLKEERGNRGQLQQALRASNDMVNELSLRLKRAEENVAQEKNAVNQLVNHTKNVEEAVRGSQKELLHKRDAQVSKIQQLQDTLNDTRRSKDLLERQNQDLQAEMKGMQMDIKSLKEEFNNKTMRMDEESKAAKMELHKKTLEQEGASQAASKSVQNQIEQRLAQLEAAMKDSLAAHGSQLASVEKASKQAEGKQGEEKKKLEQKVQELAAGIKKTMEEREKKMLEENNKIRQQLEEKLREEQKKRDEAGSGISSKVEEQFKKLKADNQKQMAAMHEQFKADRVKLNEKITRMNDAVNLIEGQLDEARKQIDKVLAAEIQTRKLQDKLVSEKVMDVHEKLRVGIATLQQSMTSTNGVKNDELSQLRMIIADQIDQSKESIAQNLSDMGRQVEDLKMKLNTAEREVEELRRSGSEQGAVNAPDGDELKYRVRKMNKKQEEMDQEIADIKSALGDPNQLKRDINEAKLAAARVREEEANRLRDTEDIRTQMLKYKDNPGTGKGAPVDDAALTKLSEAIAQCKTVLNDKVEGEIKDRKSDTKDHKKQIKDLGDKVKKLGKK